jgi:putative glutamine amidotransferase
MNKNRPVIGVTPCYNYDKKMAYIKDGYCEGVNKAGGLAVLLPATEEEGILEQIVNDLDGFLISGGPDVDANYYGEDNLPFNGEISPVRDILEIFLVKKAIALNKPVFGICRGAQIMNVALGGTLFQDIEGQNKENIMLKHDQSAPKWYPTHDITIDAGSKVWNSCKSEVLRVNSFHHQAVKEVAPGFKVTARSKDSIIEAIEHINHRFAVGVQWHPELMWQVNPEFLNMFKDFVNSCRQC